MNLIKKQKLITVLIAILVFTNLLFAGNPQGIANKMVAKLSKDIELTDSQKVIIQAKAQAFAVTLQNTNTNASTDQKQVHQAYKATLDSVLTKEQKTQLVTKRNARRDAAINKIKAKK